MDRSGVVIVVVGCVFLAAGGALVMLRNASVETGAQEASTAPRDNSEMGDVAPKIERIAPTPLPTVPLTNEPNDNADAVKKTATVAGMVNEAGSAEEKPALPIDSTNPQGIIAKLGPDFRRCYNSGLESNPNMKGTVRVTARLGPDGKVVAANSSGGDGLSKDVIFCVLRRVRSAQFNPPGGGGATIVIPVNFVSQ